MLNLGQLIKIKGLSPPPLKKNKKTKQTTTGLAILLVAYLVLSSRSVQVK